MNKLGFACPPGLAPPKLCEGDAGRFIGIYVWNLILLKEVT